MDIGLAGLARAAENEAIRIALALDNESRVLVTKTEDANNPGSTSGSHLTPQSAPQFRPNPTCGWAEIPAMVARP